MKKPFAIIANRYKSNFVHFRQFCGLIIYISTNITENMKFRLIFHKRLVSFKNIDILLIYGQKSIKFGTYDQIWVYVFLVHNSAIIFPILMKLHIRIQETTSYK